MTEKSDDRVGHLNTILAPGGGNLNDPIFKSSNARDLPEYPNELVDCTILSFIKLSNVLSPTPVLPDKEPVRILLPFKDQKSAVVLRKQLNNLGNRIGTPLQPIYASRKLDDALTVEEQKLSDQSTQCGLHILSSSVRCRIHWSHNSTSFSEN